MGFLQSTRDFYSAMFTFSAPTLPDNAILIGLIGYTGSGMSQFIYDATGAHESGIGPESGPCARPITQNITLAGFEINGFDIPIVFIDTPGFDYIQRSEFTTLNDLVHYPKPKLGLNLHGLMYLSRRDSIINNTRRRESDRLPEGLIKSLCGQDWSKKMRLLLTREHVDDMDSFSTLKNNLESPDYKYWSRMRENGVLVEEYDVSDRTKAWSILKPLIDQALEELYKKLERLLPRDENIRSGLICTAKSKMTLFWTIIRRNGTPELLGKEEQECKKLHKKGQELWKQLSKRKKIDTSGLAILKRLVTGV